jgi:hypothetical protein
LSLPPGLRPANSLVRRGERGPGVRCSVDLSVLSGFCIIAAELAEESDVLDLWIVGFPWPLWCRLPEPRPVPLRVELRS